ncbi:MAG: DUF4199 domain-containing protein [Ekhidna sp.]
MKTNIALKYGAIGGIIIVSSWFIGQVGGGAEEFPYTEIVGYAIMLLALSSIFLGIKKVKDEQGHLSFKDGFINGLGITLVASIIYVIGWMIYVPSFAPDFADKYGESQVAMVEEMDITAEEKQQQIDEIKEWIETYKQPPVMAAMTFAEIFPVGLVVTLISALTLMRKQSS